MVRTLPEVAIVEELLAGWCVMPATEARGISSGPSSILAATVSPPSHGQSPRDGMAPFNLSLISHFKSLLLSWHKSLPARCDARHLSRSLALPAWPRRFPWVKTWPDSAGCQQSTTSLRHFCRKQRLFEIVRPIWNTTQAAKLRNGEELGKNN